MTRFACLAAALAAVAVLSACSTSTANSSDPSSMAVAAISALPSGSGSPLAAPSATIPALASDVACRRLTAALNSYLPYQDTLAAAVHVRSLIRKGKNAALRQQWGKLYSAISAMHFSADRFPDELLTSPDVDDGVLEACTDPDVVAEWSSIPSRMAQVGALKSRLARATPDELSPLGLFLWTYERGDFNGYTDGGVAVRKSLNGSFDGWPPLLKAIDVILADTKYA
jgi:hypothetical protein